MDEDNETNETDEEDEEDEKDEEGEGLADWPTGWLVNDPSARSPNRFFNRISFSMKWVAVTREMTDADGQILLDAHSLRNISICLSKCFALVDDAFEYSLCEKG